MYICGLNIYDAHCNVQPGYGEFIYVCMCVAVYCVFLLHPTKRSGHLELQLSNPGSDFGSLGAKNVLKKFAVTNSPSLNAIYILIC